MLCFPHGKGFLLVGWVNPFPKNACQNGNIFPKSKHENLWNHHPTIHIISIDLHKKNPKRISPLGFLSSKSTCQTNKWNHHQINDYSTPIYQKQIQLWISGVPNQLQCHVRLFGTSHEDIDTTTVRVEDLQQHRLQGWRGLKGKWCFEDHPI